jgi:ribosomal-protein-alanine N-acetyltransferase
MQKEISVSINAISGNESEYIIKDKSGITLGRIFIIDFSKNNKYCCFRFKFYSENEIFIKDALHLFVESIFNKMNLRKVNAIVDEEFNMEPFIELGFSLEGILSGSLISNKVIKDEFIFGIDVSSFRNNNSTKSVRLKGKDIELGVLTPEHGEKLLQYYLRNKNHLDPFEPSREGDFYTINAQRKNLEEEYKQFLNGESISFGIFKGDNLIGKIRVSNVIYGVFKNAFIGYSIDEKEQGKGYMKQSVKLVCDYAFEFMGLHRIEASTLLDNIKSQRVLLTCGFKEVGVCEKYLFINGRWRDHKNFAFINEKS